MRIVLQHVNHAELKIESESIEKIGQGYVLLVSFTDGDTKEMVDKLVNKITKLRIIPDNEGKMNLSINDIEGEILSLSQFTLYADTKKGNRPSFTNALHPEFASPLFDYFNEQMEKSGVVLKKGVFGGDKQILMEISGPITILFEEE